MIGACRAGLAALCLVVSACSLMPAPKEPHPAAPAADDFTDRTVVQRGSDSITFMPASRGGAVVGVDYAYTLPMCGLLGPIDVDGSFWEARETGVQLDPRPGVFRLTSLSDAIFKAADGTSVGLVRHSGPKRFPICS